MLEIGKVTRDQLVNVLRAQDINLTHQRLEIAQFLFSRYGHWSADQVMGYVNQKHEEVSKATVYNTLNLFVEKKLIREIVVDPTRVFYDANMIPHHHYYDVETCQVTDIPQHDIRIEGLPPLPDGMVAEGIDIIVRTRRVQAAESVSGAALAA